MALSAADVAIILKATDQLTPVLRSTSAELGKLQSAVGGPTKALGGLGSAMGKLAAPARGIGGLVEGLGKLGLAGFGVSALGNAFSGLAGDAIEAQKVTAQTNAVIASTRGIAGLSADEVAALATSFSKMTPFEDEAIQSAENMLLTFTNIGKDVFPGATEAVLNMSTALGQDTKESAIQLGKALNDPVQGATALRRVGVALTDAQQEQIAAFVKSGDVMSAQGVILNELQTEFGGAARAAGETFGGKLAILNTQLGNLKEAAFTPLLGVVGDFATSLADFVSNEEFTTWVSDVASSIGDTLSKAAKIAGSAFTGLQALIAAFTTDAGAMGIVLDKVRDIFGNTVADAIEPFVQAFMDAIPEIKRFAGQVMSLVQGVGVVISDVFSGDIGLAFDDLRELVAGVGSDLKRSLGELAAAFLGWIGPMIPPLLAQLQDLLDQIANWILRTALPAIKEQLAQWGAAFVDWIGDTAPNVIAGLADMGVSILDQIGRQGDDMNEKTSDEWAAAMVDWITVAIPHFIEKFGLFAEALMKALDRLKVAAVEAMLRVGFEIGTALGKALADKAGEIATQAIQWGANLIEGMKQGIVKAATGLSTAIGDAFSQIKVDAGPFHLSASGFTIDAPKLPEITLPAISFPRGGPIAANAAPITDAQFSAAVRQMGFTEAEIESICGPIAAAGVARALGHAVDLKQLARSSETAGLGNFSSDIGTFGNPGEIGILRRAGVDAQTVSEAEAKALAAAGIPVIINTAKHFWAAQGYDASTGKFDVGATNVFPGATGGGRNLSLSQITGAGGGLMGFIAPIMQRGRQIAVDASTGITQAFGDASSVLMTQLRALGDQATTSLGEAFGGSTDVVIERLSTLAERAGISLGQARADALATGTDLKTYLEDLAAPAVQAVTDRMTSLSERAGISLGAARAEAAALGVDLRTYLEDMATPALQDVTDHFATLSDRAGVDLGVARAEAAAAGVSLKAYLEEMAAPAADALSTSLDQTALTADDLDRPLTDVRDATWSLATDGFDVGKDSATQISFVLQQLSDKMPALIQQIKDFVAALMTIPTDINVNISTNTDNGGGGGGGGGGGQPQSGDRIGDTPSNQSERADLRNAGFYVDDSGVYKLAKGGIIQRPTLAMMGEHGREAVVPLGNGGLIDYDRLGQAVARALTGTPLVVAVEDIHSGLLRKAARNNGLGLA